MKKKVFSKKLSLTKMTIAALNTSEMNEVVGGLLTQVKETCFTVGCTCPTKQQDSGD